MTLLVAGLLPPEPAAARDALLGDPGGLRSDWAARGVDVDASLTADVSRVFEGGAEEDGTAARYLLVAEMRVDTAAAFGWPGGEFYASAVDQDGEDGSVEAGDFQAYSNIDSRDLRAIYEVWYQQVLLDGRLRIKAGKLDANSEFAYADWGGGFIHSSPGLSPTIQAFPSYPDPATSVNVFVCPDDRWYVGLGVYDGATQAGIETGTRGPSTFLGEPSDLFVIGEGGLRHEFGGAPGRVGLGAWRHSGDFDRFDGSREDRAEGIYAVLDQALAAPGPDGEAPVGMFAQYGWADPEISPVEHHAGAGIAWHGPLAGRSDDGAGLMASYVRFSDEPGAGFTDEHELAVEVYYDARVTGWLGLKPVLQYIDNPGGQGLPDAWVGTLRLELAL